jgi:hypothetical protein
MAQEPSSGKANNGKRTNGKRKRQHPLVDKLRPEPSDPPVIEWRGYLGRSDKDNYWRLYLTRALTDYLEIADEDIVLQEDNEKDPEAPSRIWIKETAIVTRGPPSRVPARALVCAPLPPRQWRYGRPRIGLTGRLIMVPLLPWAIAAHCWSAMFGELEQELFGDDLATDMACDGQNMRCGNVISLRHCDYEVLL